MKAKYPVLMQYAALAIFAWANSLGISSFGQSAPLNSWTQVLSGLPFQVTSLTYGNGTFLGVGGGFRLTSFDGANWTITTTSPSLNPAGVAYGNGMFLMFGTNSQNEANYILQSTNGIAWTTIYTSSNTLTAAAYGNNTWVFISPNEITTAAITSSNWNWLEFQPSFAPSAVVYGNGMFVVSGYFSTGQLAMFTSYDGISWQYDSIFPGCNGLPASNGIGYGNGVFVVFQFHTISEGYCYSTGVSSNLVAWGSPDCYWGGSSPLSSVAYGGNEFILSLGTDVFTRSDGYEWTLLNGISSLSTCTFGQGTFVAASNNNIYQSGIFAVQSNSPPNILSIASFAGLTINGTAGGVYQIQYTTNLNSSWLPLTNFPLFYSPFVWVDTSSPIVGQRFYRSVQLQ